jgi:hypothetical protein
LEISVSILASKNCLSLRLRKIKTDLEICVELILHPSGASSWNWFCTPINRTHSQHWVPLVVVVDKKQWLMMRPPVAVGVALQDDCLHFC